MAKWYSEIVTENIYGFGTKIAMLIGGIGTAILFPKILGPEQFGYFALVFSVANIWLFFSSFGIDDSMIKFISSSTVKNNTVEYLRFFYKWKYFLTIISAVSLFLFSDQIAIYLFKESKLSIGIKVSSIYVLFYSLYNYYNNIFIGLKKNKLIFYSSTLYNILRIILPIILVLIVLDYSNVIVGTTISTLLALLILIYWLSKMNLKDESKELDFSEIKKFIYYCSLIYFGTILLQWMSSVIIGLFQSSMEVGFYRIGLMWVSAIGLISPVATKVFLSFYSEKHEAEKKREMESIFRYSIRYSIIFSLLAAVELLLVSGYFIRFIYGDSYMASSLVLAVLSFLAVEITVSQVNYPLLMGVGKIDVLAKYIFSVGILTSVFSFIAAPYGIVSVAVITTVVRLLAIIILTYYLVKTLEMQFEPKFYIKPLLCAMLTFVISYPVQKIVDSFLTGILYCIFIAIVYSLTLISSKTIELIEIKRFIEEIKCQIQVK